MHTFTHHLLNILRIDIFLICTRNQSNEDNEPPSMSKLLTNQRSHHCMSQKCSVSPPWCDQKISATGTSGINENDSVVCLYDISGNKCKKINRTWFYYKLIYTLSIKCIVHMNNGINHLINSFSLLPHLAHYRQWMVPQTLVLAYTRNPQHSEKWFPDCR